MTKRKTRYYVEPSPVFAKYFAQGDQKDAVERKLALAEFHRKYRKDPVNEVYYNGLKLARQVLTAEREIKFDTWCEAYEVFGCTAETLIGHLGLDLPELMNEYRLGEWEIDHILPASWFRKHPSYAPWMHHYSNLRVIHKTKNRSKAFMDKAKKNDPAVTMIKIRLLQLKAEHDAENL